jgi:membrane protein
LDDLLLKLEILLWSPKVDSLPPVVKAIVIVVRYFYAILRDVLTTTLTLRAMGLVYITILSIVPTLALVFSGLKGLGIHHSRIEPILLNALEPLGDKGVDITRQLIDVVDNVQGGLLAGAGLLLLVYTTVSMIRKIEESLNHIWRVEGARNFLQRFGEYLSVVLVGPPLMLTAVALIAAVGSNALVDRMLSIELLGATAVLIGKFTPYLLVCLFFSLLYWFMPNTRVKFRYALLGGLVGGLLWATVGVVFATFVVNSTRNASIYASFAIVIVALMWLYISWLIVLVGAQAAFYAQNPEYQRGGYRQLNVGNKIREEVALSLMLLVAETFRDANKTITTDEIALRLKLPGILLGPVKKRLEFAGLLEITSRDRLMPSRDPGKIAIMEIIDAVRITNTTDMYQTGIWPKQVTKVVKELDEQARDLLQTRSLYDLLDQKSG